MSDYDNNGYSKSLEKIVEMAEKEYYVHLVDINRHQVIVARTLLWMSVVLIGLGFSVTGHIYKELNGEAQYFPTMVASLLLIFVSIFLSALGFTFSALAIPAFGGYKTIYEKSWAEFTEQARSQWSDKADFVNESTLSNLLEKIDSACNAGSVTNQKRGIKLRTSSLLIMASAILVTLGFLMFSFNFYL